jgi:hypothetical protein
MTKFNRIDQVDKEALERALVLERKCDPQRAVWLDKHVVKVGWREAAEDAARRQQYRTLRLRPWMVTPSEVHPDSEDAIGSEHRGVGRAAQLLRQLLDAGLSRHEPEPIVALERTAAVK